MMRSKSCSQMVFMIISMIMLIIYAETAAQSLYLHRDHDQTLTVEVIRPNFKPIKRKSGVYYAFEYFYNLGYPAKFYNGTWYPIDYSAFNSLIFFISYHRPWGRKILFTAELPYARTDFDMKIADGYAFFRYSGYESSLGNPYLGVELGSKTSWLIGGIGVRLPTMSDIYENIADVCANAIPDRLEAFHQYASINVNGMIQFLHKIGLGLQFKSGLIYFLKQEHPDLQLLHIPSTISIGYENVNMSVRCMIHSRLQYTYEDYRHFDFSGIIGLTTGMKLGNLRPGVHLGLSYYHGYRIINLGFHLDYLFKTKVQAISAIVK